MRRFRIAAAVGCLCWLGLASATPSRAADNILVIVMDDVGVDNVGVYRDGECIGTECPTPPTTQLLDALASSGMLFRNAWSAPLCTPARIGMLTGRYGHRTHVGSALHEEAIDELGLDAAAPNMAHALKAAGYETAAIGKWHVAGCPTAGGDCTGAEPDYEGHPIRSGFDYFAGSPMNIPSDYCAWDKIVSQRTGPGPDDFTSQRFISNKYATVDTADEAIAHIPTMTEPWFVWLSFNASHAPVHWVPAEAENCTLSYSADRVGMFDDTTRKMDEEILRMLFTIASPNGLLNRTNIIALGDNGTNGLVIEPPFQSSHGKRSVYEGGVNVPFIVSGPAVAVSAQGSEVAGLIHTVDVFATVMELAGIDPCAGGGGCGEDAVSLVPYLQDPLLPSIRSTVYSEAFWPNANVYPTESRQAVRGPRYKVLRDYVDDVARIEFYDLEADPLELDDLLQSPLDGVQSAALAVLGAEMNSITGHCIDVDDRDADCVLDGTDNCVDTPNGPVEDGVAGRGNQLDSDGDGIGDICDPDDNLDPDEDDDGLMDWVETNGGNYVDEGNTGTDPHDRDSDGDLVGDGSEVFANSDPTSAASLPDTFAEAAAFALYVGDPAEQLDLEAQLPGAILSQVSLTDGVGDEIAVTLPAAVPDILTPVNPDIDLIVVEDTGNHPTTSGIHAIGTADATAGNRFTAGVTLDFTFESPISAIGLQIIVKEDAGTTLIPEALHLSTPTAQTASLRLFEKTHLGTVGPSDYNAYYLGLKSNQPFTTATLAPDPAVTPGDFTYTLDDLTTVPEPNPTTPLQLALLTLLMAQAKRKKARKPPRPTQKRKCAR